VKSDKSNVSETVQPEVTDRKSTEIRDEHSQHFRKPRSEKVAWLNFGVDVMWPFVNAAVTQLMKDEVEANLKAAVPHFLHGICFQEFSLGTSPPVLGPVSVDRLGSSNAGEGGHPGVEICVGVRWDCNAKISIHVPPAATIGIRKLNLEGEVFIILRPLMESLPIVGGLQITMVSPPKISWELTGMGQLGEMPTVATALKNAVSRVLSENLVLPNRIFIHWVWGREREIDISAMQYPMPEALLRVGVHQVKGLSTGDSFLTSRSLDTYIKVKMGEREYRTHDIKDSTEPEWGDGGWSDFCMYTSKQHLVVELYNKHVWSLQHLVDDLLGEDELLGELLIEDVEGEHEDETGSVSGQLSKQSRFRKVHLWEVMNKPDGWWKLYVKRGKTYEEVGQVLLKVKSFKLLSKLEVIKAPPPPIGDAKAEGLLSIQLRCLRGLPPKSAAGAVIELVVKRGDKVLEKRTSVKSDYIAEELDPNGIDVDPAIQRMVEFMDMEGTPREEILAVSGLSKEKVSRILELRPTFHSKWNQSIHIPIESASAQGVEIHIRLLIDGEKPGAGPIELVQPFSVDEKLLKPQQATSPANHTKKKRHLHHHLVQHASTSATSESEELRFEDILILERKQKNGEAKKGEDAEKFELDISVQLFGMQEDLAENFLASTSC